MSSRSIPASAEEGGKSPAELLAQWEGDASFMQSLARGLLVLSAVTRASNGNISVAELVTLTGLPRATVRRCIYTLEAIGYLRSAPDGAAIGPEFVGMTTSFISLSPILNAHKPIIVRLRDETSQTVAFGLYEEWRARFVSSVPSQGAVRIDVDPAYEFPLYSTSIGRLLLASKTDDEVLDYLNNVDMIIHTDRTLKRPDEILDSVRQARGCGYSIIDQEVEVGLRSITVPVRDGRESLVGWINIITHVNITGLKELKSEILPKMLRAADELCRLTP